MSRIETRDLDDPLLDDDALGRRVEFWFDTPALTGLTCDAASNLYLNAADDHAVLRLTPDRWLETVIRDPRLQWADASAFDAEGALWIPAAQLNRQPKYNGGVSRIEPPFRMFKLRVG